MTDWCVPCDSIAVRGRAWISKHGIDVMALPVRQPAEASDSYAACAVCSNMAILECHHLAPRAQFGAACDRWPTVMVCRTCHEEWHRRMGQPIGDSRDR